MWTSIVITVNILCAVVAVRPQDDNTKSFQSAIQQQNMDTILMSIEDRLRSLDNIYSMHLSPTLEDKLGQYQRKLEALDKKLIRLESLVMLNLDKISENISTKNFKDDITKTNLFKKIDSIYEGLSHRLSYLDRKADANNMKIQSKIEAALTRLEKIEEGVTSGQEDMELELQDAIGAIEELKTTCTKVEENIINNTNDNFEVSLKEQTGIMKTYNDKTTKLLEKMFENATKHFSNIENNFEKEIKSINETEMFIKSTRVELKQELNEYAVKVAEMNAENWKAAGELKEHQYKLETKINSTKTEVQNGIRALMLQVGKIANKDHFSDEKLQMDKLSKNIDINFEKVFSAQNLFMDSCYRLQMDESQIESKISVILEKLMETFEKKTAIELKDIKNLERLIKNHDSHVSRNLHQTSTNLITIYEKVTKDHHQFEGDLKRVMEHLNALFSLIQDTLADEKVALSAKNVNRILQQLNEVEAKITTINNQGRNLTSSVREIKNAVRTLDANLGHKYFKNFTHIIEKMEANILYLTNSKQYNRNNTSSSTHNKNLIAEFNNYSPDFDVSSNENTTDVPEDIKKVMEMVFGIHKSNITLESGTIAQEQDIFGFKKLFQKENVTSEEIGETTTSKCMPNILNLIDVRSNYKKNDCSFRNKNNDETDMSLEEVTTEYYDDIKFDVEQKLSFNGSEDYSNV